MKEIAEMLKRLGPNYSLEWRMEYFGPEKSLVMTLIYRNVHIMQLMKHTQTIPFAQIENMNEYGPRILEDMFRSIETKLRDLWGAKI